MIQPLKGESGARMSLVDKLERSWHEHFDVPILHHSHIGEVPYERNSSTIHVVGSVFSTFNLAFYSKVGHYSPEHCSSRELIVSLHGAATGPLRYPQFRRVESLREKASNLLSFADPTLQYSEDPDFRIGWYAGGADWDPLLDIAKVVRNAQEALHCDHVAFVGSSAGGHAALRISAMFEGSLAFVMDPQTDVARYYWPSRNRYYEYCWPEISVEIALNQSENRVNLARIYGESNPSNFVYYRQSTGDAWHQRNHAEPFQASLQTLAGSSDGRYKFVYEEGEREGHGKITPREFDRHYAKALNEWRDLRE